VTLAWPSGPSGSTIAGGQSLRPSVFRSCRSVDFPAPSSALGRCRPGPRGLSASAALPGEIDPHDLRLACRALTASLEPATTRRTGPGLLLSWSYPLVASPPYSTCASTPERRPETLLVGPVFPVTDRVPSSWFLTTSTACSAQGLRVCCTPLPALGFIAFHAADPHCFRRSRGRRGAIPAMRARTLRRVPLADSRTASLRPLPSCRCRALALPGPGGLGSHAPKGVREPPEGGCTRACAVVTMLRFAEANPHVVSSAAFLVPKRVDDGVRLSVAVPPSLGIFVAVDPGEGRVWRAVGSKALLHRRVRCRPVTVASDEALVPPMGFVPLQGPPTSALARRVAWETRCTLTRSGTRAEHRADGGSSSRCSRSIPPWVPPCDGRSRSTRRSEVAVADPLGAFSARWRDLVPRPGAPPFGG